MRTLIALFVGGLAAGASSAILKFLASENSGAGFSSGEIRFFPWIVFVLVFFAIKSTGKSSQAENSSGETTGNKEE
jgi:hypothetical protein